VPNDVRTAAAGNGQRHPSSPSSPADVPTSRIAATMTTESAAPRLGGDAPPPNVWGPVAAAWREGTLTRAQELEALCSWVVANHPKRATGCLVDGIHTHIKAARQAANVAPLNPQRALHMPRQSSLRERAMSNLQAAEAHLLNIAPSEYLLGQMPSILQHVRRHLAPGDPRREELQRIGGRVGLSDPEHPQMQIAAPVPYRERERIVEQERAQIVAAMRAASSASLREQVRVRNFRDVLVATTVVMTLLAIALTVIGFRNAALLPLCFAPEEAGTAVVVCPNQQSTQFPTTTSETSRDIDDEVRETVRPWDLLIVELLGLAAAAVAAAAAIRKIRGSSERYGVPLALAALKLPTGAVTAVLGLLLMRGQFVPGLSALDSSAQILAWALVFGYAQQLFTRLVDQQGQTVLDSVRGAGKVASSEPPAI